MKHSLLFALTFIFSGFCFSQQISNWSDKDKPIWLSGNNNIVSTSFRYFVGVGNSESMDTAIKMAIYNVILEYAQANGIEGTLITASNLEILNNFKNHEVKTITDFAFSGKVMGKVQKFNIPCLSRVEYYWEEEWYGGKRQYQYWVLVRIAKPGKENDCNLDFYKSHGKSAVWLSAIVPGLGQMHLGYKTKGTILLTTTAILVAGSLTSQVLYNDNSTKYENSLKLGQNDDAQVYKSNADAWFLIRNINLVALGGVYVFNLVDALTSKGVKIYASKNSKIDIYPTYCMDAPLITFRIKL